MKVITELKTPDSSRFYKYGLLEVVDGKILKKAFSDNIDEFPDYRSPHEKGHEIYETNVYDLSNLSKICHIYTPESHPEMFI